MTLRDRIRQGTADGLNATASNAMTSEAFYALKSGVHQKLVERLDLHTLTDLPKEALAASVKTALLDITASDKVPLNARERTVLISDIMDEIMGFGPIDTLVNDQTVQDILVNGHDKVYVEKEGMLHLTPITFRDNDHLMQVIDKIVSAVGRRIDEASPMVDARMPDGSRVNVIIPPLSLSGPLLSIRKFGAVPVSEAMMLANQTFTKEMMAFLRAAVHAKLNILISGGTGAGKTTLLNVLSAHIPDHERIVTIEDSAELRLNQHHTLSLESRPANIEGKGEITLTDLVKNSLRMRPDRIIVGETRGAEVMDMLQAMNTGHPGSMSTIHANSPSDAISRMEIMAGMSHAFFSEVSIRRLISQAIHIIVQLARLADGKRRITSISEVMGMEGDTVITRPLFTFEQQSMDDRGAIRGIFKGEGHTPRYADHIRSFGIRLDPEAFSTSLEVSP
ncbi:CpaF family protein [Desulfoluna butyratoxydans]|uniref:Type ii secretion system protein e n=1 Tax=Desulfoluna butyratoxydans TaxID=231438 RepID=A0A4U8YW05_9BACT|nr:CpaF family protein [Desulfoluna butyratoxydans]VFQ46172.1 type ii secretion system protein e [Desulfoluna butyratoxydans]